MRRVLSAAGLVAIVLVAWAAPAGAHAALKTTEPAAATAVPEAPGRVLLRFTESVEASFGAIRVFDASGSRVEAGRAFHPSGQASAVALTLPSLERGSYVVTWRVISADSHPVHGAFTFRVGPAGGDEATQALARRLLAAGGGSAVVGALFTVSRFASFAALVLLVGGIAFVAVVWPGGARDQRVERVLRTAWATAVVATGAGIALQGAYAGALPLTDALRPAVVSAVLDTRFGRMSAARLVLLVLVVPLWRLLRTSLSSDRSALRLRLAAPAVLVGVGILLTLGLSGHAGAGDLIAVAALSDLVHVGAVSLWLGGLAVLALCALPRNDPDELAKVVPLFSSLAFASVVAIVASGSFQAWRQVGSFAALTTTTYGRLLLIKLALFTGLVAVGAVSRSWVRRRYRAPALALSPGPGAAVAESPATTVSRLRRSVGAEVVIAVVLLGITALLVNAQPARSAFAKPYSTDIEAKGLLINLNVDPAKAGPTDIHVYTLTPLGEVRDVEDVDALLRLEDRDIGPLKVPMRRAGPGHFVAYGFDVPITGIWKIEVIVLRSEIDQVRATTTVPVR